MKAQSELVFDEERNEHMSCQDGSNEIYIFVLPEDDNYVGEIDTAGEPLRGQHSQPTQVGKRSTSLMHEAPEEEAEHITHSLRLRRDDQTARRSAAAIKKWSHVPRAAPDPSPVPAPAAPIGSRVTKSHCKVSAEALTASATNPFTYTEAMQSPQRDHWKRAMEEERTSILINNTIPALNSREAWQLPVYLIGSKWVCKTKHNPDGSTWYKAPLFIKGYKLADFGETYAGVGKRTTFQYLISLIAKYGWNIDHLDMLTAFLNPEIDDDDIYMNLPEGWPEGLNAPQIIVRLRKALYSLKQAPQLWHEHINAFLLSLCFTQSLADPNLYLRRESILILLYVDDISMSNLEATAKAAVQVKAKLSEKYKITNLGPACRFLGMKIHRDSTGVGLQQIFYIIISPRRFSMEHTHDVSTPKDPNVELDLAENQGEKELEAITDYQAVLGSLMYAARATGIDISYAVAALSPYNSRPFSSHMNTAKWVLQYLKSTANFRLHFDGNGIGIDNTLVGYSDSDWANDSADRKPQGSHVFLAGNGAISWRSRMHSLIAMSTVEDEFIACLEALQRGKMVTPIAKGYSQGRLTTAANQLRQSACSHTYHHGNHQSSN